METLEELLVECEKLHGHLCPGQLLGVRMALVGCNLIGIEDPKGLDRKKLVVWVEIDRCMTDAVSAATGVRLGKRSLKFFDYGKVAATFLNVDTGEAVRVSALDSSRSLADNLYPELGKKERQMRTYVEAADEDLFKIQKVSVNFSEADSPGPPRTRVFCSICDEGVNDGRELRVGEEVVCRPCRQGGYYEVM